MPQAGFGIVILCNQKTDLQNLLIRYASNIFVHDNYEKLTDFENYIAKAANPIATTEVATNNITLDKATLQEWQGYVGTYMHPAYGIVKLSVTGTNQGFFKYYDFQGPVKPSTKMAFTALTKHETGNTPFDYKIIKSANARVSGIEVQIPFSAPVLFKKL